MIKLIKPDTIAFHASITEDELRQRLADEVLEQIGGLDESGKRLPGIKVEVRRGESRKGGYSISVSGPAPVRLSMLLPPGGDRG